MSDNMQRIQIRLNNKNFDKLQDIADRYGMSTNSIISFIVGQWLDQYENNNQMREKMNEQMIDTTIKHFSSGEQMTQLMNNPMTEQMMSKLLEKVASEALKTMISPK